MKPVIIETPYAGDREKNIAYAKKCMLDSLYRGEAPFASHLLYTEVLDDSVKEERDMGIAAGFAWRASAMYTVVYTDLGISKGMRKGIDHAKELEHLVVFRSLQNEF